MSFNKVSVKMVEKKGFVYNLKQNKVLYLLLLPALLYVTVFSYVPMLGIIIAFKDFDIVKGIVGSDWVGLEHFRTIFAQPSMLLAIKNTLIYGIALTFGTFPFPIILSLLLNELRANKFKRVVQTISYMPHFLSWISVVGLFFSFFALEGPYNELMMLLFGDSWEAKNILFDSKNFLAILFFTSVWKDVGWSSIVFLAAITGIDPGLYEAASIDGCGKLKQVFHITLPSIASTIVIVLIMSLGRLVSTSFDQVYGFQNVYTQEATETINTLIYRQGIENGKYSVATAFGLSQGLVSVTLILTANAISKKLTDSSIW